MELRSLLYAIPIAVVGGLIFKSTSKGKFKEEIVNGSLSEASDASTDGYVKEIHIGQINSKRRHLYRVGSWGAANIAGGAALYAGSGDNALSDFGLQSGLWGLVNTGIAVGGLSGTDAITEDYSEALRSERNYNDILLLNLGLNVGYIGVGTAMVVAGMQGVSKADKWQGHGSAIILQGLGLLMLDAVTWLGSRDRISKLLDLSKDQ